MANRDERGKRQELETLWRMDGWRGRVEGKSPLAARARIGGAPSTSCSMSVTLCAERERHKSEREREMDADESQHERSSLEMEGLGVDCWLTLVGC